MLIRNYRDAEEVAAAFLRRVGYPDAVLTSEGADGGVDVVSTGALAQVKAEVVPVGRPTVQQVYGAASASGADTFVFALGGFTQQAIEWGDMAGVRLFQFDLNGDAQPANQHALVAVQAIRNDLNKPVAGSKATKNSLVRAVLYNLSSDGRCGAWSIWYLTPTVTPRKCAKVICSPRLVEGDFETEVRIMLYAFPTDCQWEYKPGWIRAILNETEEVIADLKGETSSDPRGYFYVYYRSTAGRPENAIAMASAELLSTVRELVPDGHFALGPS